MDRDLAVTAPDIAQAAPASPGLSCGEAYRRHAAYVAAIAMRLLGRDDEVDDVVQEVFLEAVRGLARVHDPLALRGWLATVTVRTARRRLHLRRLRGWLRLDPARDYEDVAAPGASPEQRVLLARVYRVLDALPVAPRLAWTLRYVEGESLEDVAALCECSLATAKRRIAAAQQAIQEVFGHG